MLCVIVAIHKLIVYFMFLGCFLPLKYLKFHLIAYPSAILHWMLNGNRCVLSDWEKNLGGGKQTSDTEYPFMRKVFGDLGYYPKEDAVIEKIMYGGYTLAWIISLLRVVYFKA
jgi:hypothetical protein